MIKTLIILPFLFLLTIGGCIHKQFSHSNYKEWAFINLRKDYSCGAYNDGITVDGGCRLFKIYNYNQHFDNYFGHRYRNLETMERKWKDKPNPANLLDNKSKIYELPDYFYDYNSPYNDGGYYDY